MCPRESGFGPLGGSGWDFLGHRAIVGWTGLQVFPDKIVLRCALHPHLEEPKMSPFKAFLKDQFQIVSNVAERIENPGSREG